MPLQLPNNRFIISTIRFIPTLVILSLKNHKPTPKTTILFFLILLFYCFSCSNSDEITEGQTAENIKTPTNQIRPSAAPPLYQMPNETNKTSLDPGSYMGSTGKAVHYLSNEETEAIILYIRTNGDIRLE